MAKAGSLRWPGLHSAWLHMVSEKGNQTGLTSQTTVLQLRASTVSHT